ncbi:hypothetical protein EV130_102545 [Rhizobium azibense]|nr:hypothetical protein EV130_102545 [Rhizobium azibense]
MTKLLSGSIALPIDPPIVTLALRRPRSRHHSPANFLARIRSCCFIGSLKQGTAAPISIAGAQEERKNGPVIG